MGKLHYGQSLTVDFEDRLLAHLQVVIGAKLRRNESFYFSWKDPQATGDGRTSIWLHATIPLTFKYYGGKPPAMNRAWLDALAVAANTGNGLQIVPEPAEAIPSERTGSAGKDSAGKDSAGTVAAGKNRAGKDSGAKVSA